MISNATFGEKNSSLISHLQPAFSGLITDRVAHIDSTCSYPHRLIDQLLITSSALNILKMPDTINEASEHGRSFSGRGTSLPPFLESHFLVRICISLLRYTTFSIPRNCIEASYRRILIWRFESI
jgi:hypothetical protein